MFRKIHLALIIGSLTATAVPALATDHWMGRSNPALSNLLEAGGGPVFFSSRNALRTAIGESRTNDEIKKLEAQFGEGKVYRFFAVGDFMMKDAYRISSLHHGMYYRPTGNAKLSTNMDSKKLLDDILGNHIHEMVMKNAEDRFGPGAGENFHMIADALAKSIG